MTQSLRLNRRDLVDIEIKLCCFWRYVFRDFAQFRTTASDNGSGTSAFRRAIVFAEATLVVVFRASKVERRDILKRYVLNASRAGASRGSGAQLGFFFAQPVTEPGHVAIAVEWIVQNVPVGDGDDRQHRRKTRRQFVLLTAT